MAQRVNQNTVETDHWRFEWTGNGLEVQPKPGSPCQHRYSIQGDPHFYRDGQMTFDFPSANCTFVFTDGTVLVAQAVASNQALRDSHVFATDGQYFPMGQASDFDENPGWLFVQQAPDCDFYCTSMKSITDNVGQQVVPVRYRKA